MEEELFGVGEMNLFACENKEQVVQELKWRRFLWFRKQRWLN